jgi:hypothetical protein
MFLTSPYIEQAITRFDPGTGGRPLDEFYKIGMSRKKLRLDRRIEVLSRDPAHCVSLPPKMFGLLTIS